MAKYRDIADTIREKIKSGEYTAGQKLPYEYLLCVNYHCNKETMKKALEILVKEGLIIRRRGAGTFVKELNVSELNESVRTRSLSMRFEGHDVTSDIKVFEVVPSNEEIAKKLQIDEGDFVYHIIRNRSVDGKPYCVEITYIPLYRLVNLKADVLKDSLYKFVINQLHLTVQSCHLKITSALSTVQEQVFLGLAEGEPYIQEEQTTYLSNGSVFELTFNRRHFANYEFQTVIVEQ